MNTDPVRKAVKEMLAERRLAKRRMRYRREHPSPPGTFAYFDKIEKAAQ